MGGVRQSLVGFGCAGHEGPRIALELGPTLVQSGRLSKNLDDAVIRRQWEGPPSPSDTRYAVPVTDKNVQTMDGRGQTVRLTKHP